MLSGKASFFLSFLALGASKVTASVFCKQGPSDIYTSNYGVTNFNCYGTTNGQVRVVWRTTNNGEGFTDDEYFIGVYDHGNQVYRNGQYVDQASDTTVLVGSTSGGSDWLVQFECNLEFSFFHCEDGNFEFAMVDCGCPEGQVVVEDCDVSSLDSAQDAVCEGGTPEPTTEAPEDTPDPTDPPDTPEPTTEAPEDTPEPTDAPDTPRPTNAPVSYPTYTYPTYPPVSSPTNYNPTYPAPGDPVPDIIINCFSGETTVQVKEKSTPVAMKDLKMGDFVLTKSGDYRPVYAFAHIDETRPTDFLQILASDNSAVLEMTGQHLVYVVGRDGPVRSDSLKVGDLLQTVDKDSYRQISQIKKVHRIGLYSPLTGDGTVVVADGIVASNYIGLQAKANEYVELTGLGRTPFTQAGLIHMWLSPLRLVCSGISDKYCKEQDRDGYHPYVAAGLKVATYMDEQPLALQVAIMVPVLLVLGIFLAIEALFSTAFGRALVIVAVLARMKWMKEVVQCSKEKVA